MVNYSMQRGECMGILLFVFLVIGLFEGVFTIFKDWDRSESLTSNILGGGIGAIMLIATTIIKGFLILYLIEVGFNIPDSESGIVKAAYYSIIVGVIIEIIMFIYNFKNDIKEKCEDYNIIMGTTFMISELSMNIVGTMGAGLIGIKIFLL